MEQRKGGPQLTPSSLEAASPWAEQCSRGCRNTAPKNRAGMGHRGKPLPRVPLGHLLPQHELLPRRMLFQFGLQGCNTCPELCLPSAPSPLHPPPFWLCGCLGRTWGLLMGPLQRPQEEDSLPLFLPRMLHKLGISPSRTQAGF